MNHVLPEYIKLSPLKDILRTSTAAGPRTHRQRAEDAAQDRKWQRLRMAADLIREVLR